MELEALKSFLDTGVPLGLLLLILAYARTAVSRAWHFFTEDAFPSWKEQKEKEISAQVRLAEQLQVFSAKLDAVIAKLEAIPKISE